MVSFPWRSPQDWSEFMFLKDKVLHYVMPILPKDDLSHWVGRLAHQRLPGRLGRSSVELFAKAYDINMAEAEYPLEHYQSIGELFSRRLKPGARPIGLGPVVHPADSQITEAGRIEEQTLIQAKGLDYKVTELLRSPYFSAAFEGGAFFTYYLCPTDYHRVHSPVDGRIVWSCHVPGEFWPVNSWSVRNVSQLFSRNERVVVMMETPRGKAALVMVAATNVGNMSMAFDPQISTKDRLGERHVRERVYDPGVAVAKGAEIGAFNMGSTVIMLYEKGVVESDPQLYRNRHVKMGQAL